MEGDEEGRDGALTMRGGSWRRLGVTRVRDEDAEHVSGARQPWE